jgi:thymidylate synthase (FAD)
MILQILSFLTERIELMQIVNPSWEIMSPNPFDRESILRLIEIAGRTCYKSEDKITDESASKFVKMIRNRNHESVLEHVSITVKFVFDRGVSHELVRHRLCAFSQESTRYCNYGKSGEIKVIDPSFWSHSSKQWKIWKDAMEYAEQAYLALLENGAKPQEARSVLPNSLKTEIVTTANLREWRHIFRMRTSEAAHPQIKEVMSPLQAHLQGILPEVFEG